MKWAAGEPGLHDAGTDSGNDIDADAPGIEGRGLTLECFSGSRDQPDHPASSRRVGT
jgi:hypothetical protein